MKEQLRIVCYGHEFIVLITKKINEITGKTYLDEVIKSHNKGEVELDKLELPSFIERCENLDIETEDKLKGMTLEPNVLYIMDELSPTLKLPNWSILFHESDSTFLILKRERNKVS